MQQTETASANKNTRTNRGPKNAPYENVTSESEDRSDQHFWGALARRSGAGRRWDQTTRPEPTQSDDGAPGIPGFPIGPRDKTPLTAKGCTDATPDATRIDESWTPHRKANIGIRTETVSGILAFAVDDKAGEAPLAELGVATLTRTRRAGREGHVPFAYSGDDRSRRTRHECTSGTTSPATAQARSTSSRPRMRSIICQASYGTMAWSQRIT
jgi:hypothetical protein